MQVFNTRESVVALAETQNTRIVCPYDDFTFPNIACFIEVSFGGESIVRWN